MNDFYQKLEYSRGEAEKFDIDILHNCISGCVSVTKTDIAEDKQGVDYIVTLRNGARIRIDAKTREANCSRFWKHGEPEIALEKYSVVPSETKQAVTGWTLNEAKDVDMILYTFNNADSSKCYLLPFQHLRMAFKENYKTWKETYPLKRQQNRTYESEAMFVPASIVLNAIRRISEISTAVNTPTGITHGK